jgi:hypothetical protein
MGDVLDFRGDDAFSAFCLLSFDATPAAFKYILGKTDSDATKRGWSLRNGTAGDRESLAMQIVFDAGAAANHIFVYSTAATLNTAWHLYGFTYDGSGDESGITLYVDGASVAHSVETNNLSNNATTHSAPFGLGARPEDDAGNVDGKIPFAVVFNQALTASQVFQLYQSQLNGGPGVLGRSTRPMFASSVAGEEVGFNTIYNLTPSPAANDLWTVAP